MPYRLLDEEPQSFTSKLGDFGKEGLRHGTRTASNLATRAVGLPGDIFSLVNQFIAKPASKLITGEEGSPYEETLLGKVLPTTETHRKGLEQKTGEYLKPQNKIEKFVDDTIEDASLILNPTKLVATGAKKAGPIFKSLAKSLGANLTGETAKQLGTTENTGNLTKLGALFFLSVLDQPAAAKQVSQLYSKAESNLPAGAKIPSKNLEAKINGLEKSITKNRPLENLSPQEKFVITQSDKVKNLIKNGEINVEQAIAQKRSLNQELATLYREVPKLGDQKKVKGLAKQINGFLNEAISDYGKKNPKFYKPYKDADQAYGTLAQSHFLSNWIDKNVVHSPVTVGLMHLFGPVAKVAPAVAFPYHIYKLGYRIAKSPTLRKIYANALKAATKEDTKVFNKYLRELDQGLQEDESQSRYKFID
jgi:hypothetical protein